MENEIELKRGYVTTLKLGKTTFKALVKTEDGVIAWNSLLILRIDKNGEIISRYRNLILDDIRNSFGIDLTMPIPVTTEDVANKLSSLKKELKKLKADYHSSNISGKKQIKELIAKQRKSIKIFKKRNATYNKYLIRKSMFKGNIEKYLASFLIITGQVKYVEGKFVYGFEQGIFRKVSNYKSYDRLESFYQRFFDKTLYIKSDIRNIKKFTECSFSQLLKKTHNIFVDKPISFNVMYPRLFVSRIFKFSKILTNEDAKEILKSLYNFKKQIEYKNEAEGLYAMQVKAERFINSLEDKASMNDVLKELSSSETVKEFKKKKNRSIFAKWVYRTFDKRYTLKEKATKLVEVYEAKLAKLKEELTNTKQEIESKYISKEEVFKKYITREEHNKEIEELKLMVKTL